MVFEGVVEGPPLLLLLKDVFFERFLMDAHTKKKSVQDLSTHSQCSCKKSYQWAYVKRKHISFVGVLTFLKSNELKERKTKSKVETSSYKIIHPYYFSIKRFILLYFVTTPSSKVVPIDYIGWTRNIITRIMSYLLF